MSAAALTRTALDDLVKDQARRVGKTEAYKDIAKEIGSSASWIRKFLAESNEVAEPRMTLFENIRVSYGNLCNRVEQQNRNDERRLRLVRGKINAVTEGFSAQGVGENPAAVREIAGE